MVNVTKENFLEQSNDLIEHLPTASFVAIDEEMTGITLPNTRLNKADTPAERYAILRKVPELYSIIQFGIALFIPDPENEGDFLVRKYNFHLFPSTHSTRPITLNPSSIHFLTNHQMDYNMWIKEGIPYCTSMQAAELIARYRKKARALETSATATATSTPTKSNTRQVELTRPDDVNFHARAMANLREWIDSARSAQSEEGTSFLLPPTNAFLRRALYESIHLEYPSLVLEKSNSNQIKVLRMTPTEKLVRNQRQRREAFQNLQAQELGFWRIFYALSQANQGFEALQSIALAKTLEDVDLNATLDLQPTKPVPIVVHNGLQDLLFLLTHFHGPTLPDDYQQGKALIRRYFPNIYDTKVMATEGTQRHENTALSPLYTTVVTQEVSARLKLPDDESGSAHEASHDAYMTGSVFFGLIIGAATAEDDDEEDASSIFPWSAGHYHATWRERYQKNKLHLMLTMYTLDLEATENDPLSRGMHPSSTFRVAGSDPKVSTRDIVRCLTALTSPFTDTRLHFEIIWIDDTTFMVAARDAGSFERLMEHGNLIESALKERFPESQVLRLKEYLRDAASPSKKRSWNPLRWLGIKQEEDDDKRPPKKRLRME